MLATEVDWTQIIETLIITIPAIIAAIFAARVHKQVGTPSGKNIGRQVEDALHVVLGNNYRLQSIGTKVDAPDHPKANGEEAKVEAIHESQ